MKEPSTTRLIAGVRWFIGPYGWCLDVSTAPQYSIWLEDRCMRNASRLRAKQKRRCILAIGILCIVLLLLSLFFYP